jgi:Flp pilus assembly protein TadG
MHPPSGWRARAPSRPPDGRTLRPLAGRPSRAGRRGQALVELALILPVMLFLILGAVDLGRVFYSKIAVTDAAKEGALVASQGKSSSEITTAVTTEARGGLVEIKAGDVTATPCPANPNGTTPPVTVTAKAPFRAITPFISTILGGNPVMIGATATARCRYTPPFPGTPSPTPTPTCLIVPDLKNPAPETVAQARTEWAAAGFTGAFSPSGQNSTTVTGQDQVPGACLPASTSVTVTYS